jgi:hypothetical protein
VELVEADAEFCWVCNGFLCGWCWEELGQCGHDPEVMKFRMKELLSGPIVKTEGELC